MSARKIAYADRELRSKIGIFYALSLYNLFMDSVDHCKGIQTFLREVVFRRDFAQSIC